MNELFTPRVGTSKDDNPPETSRVRWRKEHVEQISGGALEPRGLGFKGRIKYAGAVYDVYGLPCGFPNCNCDAMVVPVNG